MRLAQAATEVFVGGLAFDATEADLEATFSVAGEIAEARARAARVTLLRVSQLLTPARARWRRRSA